VNFGIVDWLIAGVYILAVVVVGSSMRRYVGKVESFMVAGKQLDVYLGVASLSATEFGIVTVMYAAELGYKNGFAGAAPGVLLAAAMLLVGGTGFVIKPLRESGVLTIPELLERRFGSKVRILAAAVIVTGGLLNMGVFLRIGGQFLMIVTGLGAGYVQVAMSIIVLMVLLYTTVGGMVSVLVADYLQFLMVGTGLVVVSVLVAANATWSGVVTAVERHSGAGGFNPLLSADMGWTYITWQALNALAIVVTWQTMIQRVLSAKNAGTARRVYTRTSFYFVGRFLIPAFWGMGALAMLPPALTPKLPLEAMPTYLAYLLPSGMLGLIVAAMLAAEMSTEAGYMLTWGTILFNDIIAPLRRRPLSASAGIRLNRVILVCIGAFLLLYGLWYQIPGRAFDYLSITANIYLSSISVLLISCCYWKRANAAGAVGAIIGGAISPVVFLVLGSSRNVQVAGLASFLFAAAGMVAGSQFGRTRSGRVTS
jgi:SSS family solute:Na+ symporter